MTLAQIQLMLDAAIIRENNEYADQAALHNKKVKRKSYELLNAKKISNEKPKDIDYDKIDNIANKYLEEQRNALKVRADN